MRLCNGLHSSTWITRSSTSIRRSERGSRRSATRIGELPELLDRLSAERDRIDQQIGNLVTTRDRLDTIITTAIRAKDAGKPCPRVSTAP
ncbi:hypothetical protein [Sphaerisporangium perillae]|uniref:hypothetical protein n=1 Tax=Sphaerisporangium perillae TaxID=2935860 RepID=UPI00200CFD7B|nr:hypothetical protein [Sphaerisporangium perillae]